MAKLTLRLTPPDMLELCDWVDRTDPTLMAEQSSATMRHHALDAIAHHDSMTVIAASLHTNLQVIMEVLIEGDEDHILYAMMRWKQQREIGTIPPETVQKFSVMRKTKGTVTFATAP